MARAFFVLTPGIFAGLLFSILHPAIGLVIGACVAGLGIQVTAPRLDRGEAQRANQPGSGE